jgi:hypothetical protein
MTNVYGRVATFSLLLASGLALGACGQTQGPRCGERGGQGCAAPELDDKRPLPPDDYVVKWSTCTHFIEGDARLRNNSRVVRVRGDGTVPVQRAEPTSDPADNVRRVILAKLPRPLLGGEGLVRRVDSVVGVRSGSLTHTLSTAGVTDKVSFIKLGQAVATREADGSIVHWVVSSEPLGEPVQNENGKLEYHDTCFRSANGVGRDTAGLVGAEAELAGTCVVEDREQGYNALSAFGYSPLFNYADVEVATANDPSIRPHPDGSMYVGHQLGSFKYAGMGAALNDINGAERDWTTNYYGGETYCHMIVSGGLEVPGAKRPATKSLPAPGVVNGKTYIVWRPVNLNVIVANGEPARAPDPVESPPAPADLPVDAAEAVVPM